MDLNFSRGQFTEAELESAIISLFQAQGYEFCQGAMMHRGFTAVLLKADLRLLLSKQYPDMTASEMDKSMSFLENIPSSPLYPGNRKAFLLVNEGFNIPICSKSKPLLCYAETIYSHPSVMKKKQSELLL